MFFRRCIASFAILALSLATASAAAEPASDRVKAFVSSFPDNADLRSKLFSRLLGAPREIALTYGESVLASASGPVLVRVVNRAEDFLIEFRNGSEGAFEGTKRGTCVVQRSSAKGNYLVQARIFLQDDPSCYLRLYPQGSTTRGDIVMYGALVKKGLSIEGMLYQALIRPLSAIVESTRRAFDWNAVFAADERDAAASFAAEYRAAVVSGSLAASALRPAAIARRLEASDSVEAFLAAQSAAGEEGSAELGDPVAFPAGFSSDRNEIVTSAAFAAFPRYIAGKGIAPSALRASLYLGAISSPGSIYALFGEGLRAIAVPSFDASGRFDIDLLGGGREASWDEIFAGRKDAGIRVVRLPAAQR